MLTDFNALKSCGGIHTREKIVAEMADKYILMVDKDKYHEKLNEISGIVGHSLFCKSVKGVIIATEKDVLIKEKAII